MAMEHSGSSANFVPGNAALPAQNTAGTSQTPAATSAQTETHSGYPLQAALLEFLDNEAPTLGK